MRQLEKNYFLALSCYQLSLDWLDIFAANATTLSESKVVASKSQAKRALASDSNNNCRNEAQIKKRFANVKNELGTFYLNECSNLLKYDEENLGK